MRNDDVTKYIKDLPEWQQAILREVRDLVHDADPDISETIKWHSPAYEHDGLAVWTYAAHDWVSVAFPQGALFDDPQDLFEPTENKAMRTVKLHEGQDVPRAALMDLVGQAVEANKAGHKVPFERDDKPMVEIPHEMERALQSARLLDAFFARPPQQQQGYIAWVSEVAQKEGTREQRIVEMLRELRDGGYMPSKNSRG